MPFLTQPPAFLLSSERPIQYEVIQTGGGSLILQNAVVELYFNSSPTPVSTFRVKSTGFTPNILPGLDEYKFCIDVASRINALLEPFRNIPDAFVLSCPTVPTLNSQAVGSFYIVVNYEYLDLTDNTVKQIGTPADQSNERFAVNIVRGNTENMYLDEFFPTFPTLARVLTNSAKVLNVCKSDNVFLSMVKGAGGITNSFRTTLYDAAGAVIGTKDTLLNSSIIDPQMFTINAGIDNGLACITGTQQTPSYDLNDPALACYVIEFGLLSLGGFIPLYEPVKYNLDQSCPCCERRKLRIHWLNCLGGVDSYTFCSIKELKHKYKGQRAQKSKTWDKTSLTPNNPTEASIFKTRSKTEKRYRIVSQDINNTEAAWLSEMLDSVHVYFEDENGVFLPVIIEDGEQTEANEKNKTRFELSVLLSDCTTKQSI